jgi:hypothetical protein
LKIRLAAAAAVVLGGVMAPTATGAVVNSDRECYREGAAATFVGTGFRPNEVVATSIDGRQIFTDVADSLGRSVVSVTVPAPPRSQQTNMLTMSQAGAAITATKTFSTTQVYVVTKPGKFSGGQRLRIRAGGFYGVGRTLYAHVRGPTKRNLRIGRVRGACGRVSATKKVILKRRDRSGFYTVQFDTRRRYIGKRSELWVRRSYILRRIIKFSRASAFSRPVFGGQQWEVRSA